jgi:type IV fimbrial biogenesis protein FimT
MKQNIRQRGFTLIELMVVVTILIITLGLTAPSFSAFLHGQQVRGMAYDLTTDLLLARSEALKRNVNVAIARSGDSWSAGWTTVTQVANERISTRNAAARDVVVSDAPDAVVFDVNGRVTSPAADVRITISAGGASRCVELGLSGRARSSVGACT